MALLFLFPFGKTALASLPTARFVALRPLFPFQQAEYAQVFSLKPAPFYKLSANPGSTNKSAVSLLFCFDFWSILATLSSPPPFLLPQNLCKIWQELSFLSSCSIRLKWIPRHSFLPENDVADELAKRGVLLMLFATASSLSPLVLTLCLFSEWRWTVSSKFFYTQVSLVSTEELVLPRNTHCALSRLCCNRHSLLLSSYLTRIGRIVNLLCSTCNYPF